MKKLKLKSLDQVLDENIGLRGTLAREQFEKEVEKEANKIASTCSAELMDQISFITGE